MLNKEWTTWRELLERRMQGNGETLADLIHITIPAEELDRRFDRNYGRPYGSPFTVWSRHFVYFPLEYDGYESVGCAPRDPCDISCKHQGGEG